LIGSFLLAANRAHALMMTSCWGRLHDPTDNSEIALKGNNDKNTIGEYRMVAGYVELKRKQ
jgi:hypothetical protein